MDKKTKEVVDFMLDRIKTQKTMFIPVVAISAFALVGYAKKLIEQHLLFIQISLKYHSEQN